MNGEWTNLGTFNSVLVDVKELGEDYVYRFWKGEHQVERVMSGFGLDSMSGRDLLVWIDSYVEMVNEMCGVEVEGCPEMEWRFNGQMWKGDLED
jgi:hypothetical protein